MYKILTTLAALVLLGGCIAPATCAPTAIIPTTEPSKIPIDMHISICVAPDKSLRMSYTRDMTIQECRDSINRFLEFVEKETGK